ncbi:MAG: hypothetical protein V3V12_01285 [Gammaproteobacteria bacterium]
MTVKPLITPRVENEDKAKVDAIFSHIETHMGFVPAGLQLYSASPALLETFVQTVGYFMSHATLSQELLATIRYLVSSDANCKFCINFNEGILLNLGKSHEDLQAAKSNHENAPLNADEKVLLALALKGINDPEGVSHSDMKKARDSGYSDRDIFDAVAIAANNKAFTHVLRSFKVEHQGAFA